ncbi:hypothetical protein [Actinoplanes sp. NPDC049265]
MREWSGRGRLTPPAAGPEIGPPRAPSTVDAADDGFRECGLP